MHLRNVEIFCDTVVHRSFSKAAEARGISQPAVSQAIQQLEDRLGLTLIDRSKRPLELTSAGRVYYDGCRKLLDDFRDVEGRVQQLNGRIIGRVRIAAIYSISSPSANWNSTRTAISRSRAKGNRHSFTRSFSVQTTRSAEWAACVMRCQSACV